VEVPAGFDPAIREDHRVVDRRLELGVGDQRRVGEGVAHGSADLWSAAQRVGVLHARVVFAMRGDDLRAVEQPGEIRGARGLARLRPQRDQVRGERAVGAQKRLHRHRCRDVRDLDQAAEVLDRQDQHPQHPVGAVDQRQALLGPQGQGLDAGRRERARRVVALARSIEELTFTEQDESAVGEWGEISARAE
jgi:hypothetical protein